jgi:Mg-chelatase subunit ChlI
MPVSAEFRLEG